MGRLLEQLGKKLEPVPAGSCLVGVSGGADSVALLIMLAGTGAPITAVHVNHGLRGEESDADELFVRSLCEQYRIPLKVYRPDLRGKKDENTARDARFRCFRECMEETGAEVLVLAHHADDLAETFLMRLIRGAGPEGLGCMKPADEREGIRILRPMLKIRRGEIRNALAEAGIPWREDSSNRDPKYFRNSIRLRILPMMEEMNPGAVDRIAAAARRIADDNEALDRESRRFLERFSGEKWIDCRELAGLAPGIQVRILRIWWRKNTPRLKEHELSAEQTGRLADLVRTEKGKVNLPGGLYAVRGRETIHLTGFPREMIPGKPVSGERTDFGPFSLIQSESLGNPGDGKTAQEVPAGFTEGCVIRTRKPGDRISPFGMTGTRKLQDYLTDRGIDEPWRDRIPLLCRGQEVLLAAGVGAGNIPAWEPGGNNIRLTWQGDMPWNR